MLPAQRFSTAAEKARGRGETICKHIHVQHAYARSWRAFARQPLPIQVATLDRTAHVKMDDNTQARGQDQVGTGISKKGCLW